MNKIVSIIILLCISKYNFSQNDSIQVKVEYKQFFYPNGRISSEGYIKNNIPVGYWKSYYLTGIKKSEGKWLNSKLDSVWIFYDQIGDTIEKINYYFGQKNGYNFKYYKTDNHKNKIFSKELYVNGKRNDKSYYFYENGNIKKVVPYVNDKRHGIGFEYDKEKNIVTIERYRYNEIIEQENINRYNESGEKEGVWRDYYDNGNLREEKTYLNGKLNGYYKIYNEEGNFIEAIKYKNGELYLQQNDFETNIEIKEEYDRNENLVFQGSYKNNTPIGIHRYFNNNGKVIKSINFDFNGTKNADGIVLMNGNEDGSWIYYYQNGNKQAEGVFSNGNKTGKWTYFYENGVIKQTGSYANGKFTGSWKWYYSKGDLLKEEFYIYGKLDGETIEYSETGEIISKGNYIEGFKEGEWIYKIGDQEMMGKYVVDLKDGTWKSYYLDENTLSFEGRFLQGNKDGKHIYYFPNGMIKEERYYNSGEKVKSWSKYNEKGELIIVIQFRDGKEYKINGEKVKTEDYEN